MKKFNFVILSIYILALIPLVNGLIINDAFLIFTGISIMAAGLFIVVKKLY